MSTAIEIGGELIDLLPYATAAIEIFGGVRPESAGWLAAGVAKFFNEARVGHKIIRDGTPIPNDLIYQFELGLWKGITIEALRALDPDTIRHGPDGQVDLIAGRVIAWAYGEQRRRRLVEMGAASHYYRSVSISKMQRSCGEMTSLSKFRLPLRAAPLIPLPHCKKKQCHCLLKPSRAPPTALVRFDGNEAIIEPM